LDFLIIVGATWPVFLAGRFVFQSREEVVFDKKHLTDEKHTPATPNTKGVGMASGSQSKIMKGL
jgi:hypothetical protein